MTAKRTQKKQEGSSDPRDLVLDAAISALEKQYSKGTVMVGFDDRGDDVAGDTLPVSTGSLCVDFAIGVKRKLPNGVVAMGVPKGRIIEIIGPEASGKTTMCYHMIAEAQKLGQMAAMIDMEHTMDPDYAKTIGVDTSRLVFTQPNCGEDALNILDTLVKTGRFGIIVVDSVAALVPQAELDGNMGDAHIGLQARLMSQALRKINPIIGPIGTTIVFTNQIRHKIGVQFGSPETTSGGNALKFYSSIRMDIRRIGGIKDNSGNIYGNRTRVKVIKNKVAPPYKQAEFDIIYGKGVDKAGELIDLCVSRGVMQKNGSWFSFGDSNVAQGRDQAANATKEDDELRRNLMRELMETLK